jgi:tetratricopeptide (TPR) repeat protein
MPLFSALEAALYALTAVVSLGYVVYNLYLWKGGRVCPRKLVLLSAFLGASYYLYVHVEDFIVGFAIWSAFHCLQYYGIVWVYNSNRVRGGKPMTRLAQFLFRPGPALILVYALMIVAYGSVNYFQKFVYDETARRLLLALVATSSALHYYYDGFIWKVREKETRRFLGIGSMRGALGRALPLWNRGLVQAGYLAAVVAALGALETWRPNDELVVRQSVAAAAPGAEDGHLLLGEALRRQGRFSEALESYREAVRLNPALAHAHVNLGVTLAALGRIDEAIGAYAQALSLDSGIPAAHYNLAVLLASKGLTTRALRHYQQAFEGKDAEARRLAADAIKQIDSER